MPARKARRNPFALNRKGVSTIISTIIITGTLLIILVIASFVSANVLDMQIANTEFEQAKTNMLTLDETIQDVALRRGSGGYVQFNQRSGGIGINITTQKLTVLGPSQLTVEMKNPTTTSGSWTNPQGAYLDGGGYANMTSAKPSSTPQIYWTYGFDILAGSTIEKVKIRCDAWTADNEQIRLDVSWDGGTSWLASPAITLTQSEAIYWSDITTLTTWTPARLNDTNFRIRVFAFLGGAKEANVFLDWLPVEVTYTPPLGTIYQSSPLVGILYRGGSKVSGTSLDLRGTDALVVNMSDSLGYVRVATDNGLKIKLDYYRIRIATNSTLMIGGEFYNVTQITFINLINGPTGGSDVVNFKVQNLDVNTFTREYNANNTLTPNDVTIYVRLGNGEQVPIRLYSPIEGMSLPMSTAIIFTEVKILVSTS